LTKTKIQLDLIFIQFLHFSILFRFVRTKFPSFRKFKRNLSVFKTYIITHMLKTTKDLIINSIISESGFQDLESQVISVHVFEMKICPLTYLSFASC